MNCFLTVICVLSLTSSCLASPQFLNFPVLARQETEGAGAEGGSGGFLDFSGYGRLVQELIDNLGKAAQQAREAVTSFTTGLQEETQKCQQRFEENLNRLRERINHAIDDMANRFSSSGNGISECIASYNEEAAQLFNATAEKANQCQQERINEGEELIASLSNMSERVNDYYASAYNEMRACIDNGVNFLTAGSCLGALALKTEVNGAVFLAQSGLEVARVNMFMATLPAQLEMCAGSSLVEAGMGTARIVMEIGSCSATSIYNNFYNSEASTSSSAGNADASPSILRQ